MNCLHRHSPRARGKELGFLLAITVFAGWVFSEPFFRTGLLAHDNLFHYSFDHDVLDSLNRFHEPAYWFPHNQFGIPAYYFGILGPQNLAMPPFVFLGALFWVLGQIGIHVVSIQPFFVAYFALLVPGLFLISVWLVARQIFRSTLVIRYVLLLAAFSPGVHFNLTDVGTLEHLTYCLFFVAAYFAFIRQPDRYHFGLLSLTLLLLALSCNHPSLAFEVWALPAFLLCTWWPRAYRRRIRTAIAVISWRAWGCTAVLMAVCLLPTLLPLTQIHDLRRVPLTTLRYSKMDLRPGNPLEPLSASTPGVGLDWNGAWGDRHAQYSFTDPRQGGAYTYLGLLCLPLAGLGLVYGRARLRFALGALILVTFGVVLLAQTSPFFDVILSPPSPLLSMSHFSDITYRGGGFLLWIFLAAAGLEVYERGRPATPWIPSLIFFCWSAISLAFSWQVAALEIRGTIFGFCILIALLVLVTLITLGRLKTRRRSRLLPLLLLLTVVDVSTLSAWKMHLVIEDHQSHRPEDTKRGPLSIGLAAAEPNMTANGVLMSASLCRLLEAKAPIANLPNAILFRAAHVYQDSPSADDFQAALQPEPQNRSLALDADAARQEPFRHFLAAADQTDATNTLGGTIYLDSITYNTQVFAVTASQPSLLFLREAFSPYWEADIAGEPVPIARALGHFEAVPVPAGSSQVRLRFRPPFIGYAIGSAYFAVLGLVAWILRARRQQHD